MFWLKKRESAASRVQPRLTLFLILAAILASPRSSSVVFRDNPDSSHNTTAPSGELAGSGWQYTGVWNGFPGTVISPRHFITAAHVGGSVGGEFQFRGQSYVTDQVTDDPETDLRIWRVTGFFPESSPLYMSNDEAGKELVVIGRGGPRGDEVRSGSLLSSPLKGWKHASSDGVQRWGRNVVSSVIANGGIVDPLGGGTPEGVGDLLKAEFNTGGISDEAHLTLGDSSGGVFIQEDGEWRLAGVNYGVDGPFNDQATGPGFLAALFDVGGMYRGGEGNWSLNPDLPTPQPSAFYATRISSRIDWIESVIGGVAGLPELLAAVEVAGPYEPLAGAVFPEAGTARVELESDSRFFQLRHATETFQFSNARVVDGMFEMTFDPVE